jgi:hypothetical protein
VLIDNLATFRTNPADDTTGVTKNTASLVSTGGVVRFHGDIGTDPGASEAGSLAVTDAEFTAGNHTVTLASGDFRRIDGPGSLVMRGVGAGSQFVIRDDVGGRTPLALFDADADLLVLGSRTSGADVVSSADLIAAGDVRLNTANPSTSPFATIADTSGGLRIASTGDVSIGAGEKLSSTGRLEIDAAGTARLADLSASEIDVNASQIQIQTRAPGPVALPDGSSVTDFGVDWAANDILTNVVPTQLGAGPAPTFVLGSGGIETAVRFRSTSCASPRATTRSRPRTSPPTAASSTSRAAGRARSRTRARTFPRPLRRCCPDSRRARARSRRLRRAPCRAKR